MPSNSFFSPAAIHRITNYLTQSLLSLPSDIAFWVNNLNWVEETFLYPRYQQSRQSYLHPPDREPLSSLDQEIITGLMERGLHVTSLEALGLPDTDRFLEAANQLTQELCDRAQDPIHAQTHTLTATAQQLMTHREIFDWGISNRLFSIIEGYLGLPVAYDGLSFYYSIANGEIAGPRRWHRDREDWRMVKVAVYLTDVDQNSGPFECVTPEVNSELLQKSAPKYRRFNHLEDQNIAFDGDQFKSCLGKAGTVIFVDTALYYHRGKPPISNDRSAVFFSYFSQSPKNPFFCGRSPFSDQELKLLSTSYSEQLKIAILWKDYLSGLGKYIPKNRLKV
jgi:hypothetical protein